MSATQPFVFKKTSLKTTTHARGAAMEEDSFFRAHDETSTHVGLAQMRDLKASRIQETAESPTMQRVSKGARPSISFNADTFVPASF